MLIILTDNNISKQILLLVFCFLFCKRFVAASIKMRFMGNKYYIYQQSLTFDFCFGYGVLLLPNLII